MTYASDMLPIAGRGGSPLMQSAHGQLPGGTARRVPETICPGAPTAVLMLM